MPQDTVASLALKLKWLNQQLLRDLPTLAGEEKRLRQQELAQAEEALRRAEAAAAAD